MALVAYSDSDSEGSDSEQKSTAVTKSQTKAPAPSNFAIDRANPTKIRVNLNERLGTPSTEQDGERPAKRARVGAGAFSGFNAMLPPPKRDNLSKPSGNASKPPARKVFSLKTGAEPAFSRDSDMELRNSLDDWNEDNTSTIPEVTPKKPISEDVSIKTTIGRPMMFKPLSVSRNKKKKPIGGAIPKQQPAGGSATASIAASETASISQGSTAPKKISLFSAAPDPDTNVAEDPVYAEEEEEEDEIIDVLPEEDNYTPPSNNSNNIAVSTQPDTLHDIADNLNLSAAERRQLFGRNNRNSSATATNVINFNTDTEYAANQALNAQGQQAQHNPVRAIGSGKHSLKQLISSATTQKDALEESFAAGRRNKKEAGSKYGW